LSRSSPFVITLSDSDRGELERRARCYASPHAVVVRAKIVLPAACGLENTVIAARLDVHVDVVSRWRKRFAAEGLAGLADRPRTGRPRVFAATVRRWLDGDAIRPWRYRSWIFPRDPDFEARAGRVLDLYQRTWAGCELGEDEYVVSSDEKPGIQALSRVHAGLPPRALPPWRRAGHRSTGRAGRRS
jgi:Winged helix-turn helix